MSTRLGLLLSSPTSISTTTTACRGYSGIIPAVIAATFNHCNPHTPCHPISYRRAIISLLVVTPSSRRANRHRPVLLLLSNRHCSILLRLPIRLLLCVRILRVLCRLLLCVLFLVGGRFLVVVVPEGNTMLANQRFSISWSVAGILTYTLARTHEYGRESIQGS